MTKLSVVVPGDREETFRRALEAFRRQTIPDAIELVLLRWAGSGIEIDAVDGGRATVRIVVVDVTAGTTLAEARAAGVRASTAPLVFLSETHAYPRPDWAAAVLGAAADDAETVVASVFANGNPSGRVSWAGFLSDYGAFGDDLPRGAIADAPIHKGTYRRSDLLSLGERLPAALAPGDELGDALRLRGRRARLEPNACIEHFNVSRLRTWLRGRFLIGYSIGANRAGRWGLARRIAYGLASPAIAAVLWLRTIRDARRMRRAHGLPGGLGAAIAAGAAFRAAGEAVGYFFGDVPRMRAALDFYELHESTYATDDAIGGRA